MLTTVRRNDVEVIPTLQSWLFWRDVFEGKIVFSDWNTFSKDFKELGFLFPRDDARVFMAAQHSLLGGDILTCKFCNNLGYREDEFGSYLCLCNLLRKRTKLDYDNRNYQSSRMSKTLDDIKDLGSTPLFKRDSAFWRERAKVWARDPVKWLLFSSGTGTGKSHILSALANIWKGWSLYVVMTDFQSEVFGGVKGRDLEDYTNALKHVPILLLDDVGIEWKSDFVRNVLQEIIEFRAREEMWQDHPTVIATNIEVEHIIGMFRTNGASRIGSRLLDSKHTEILSTNKDDARIANRKAEGWDLK